VEYIAAPFVGRVPARRFVIVCGPRTGSELLRTLLDSLEGVRCQGELLVEPKRWPVAYLNGRAAIGGLDQRAWGCKVIDSHLSPVQGVRPTSRPSGDRVLAELAGQGWVIVHLRRRDRLAQALSGLLGHVLDRERLAHSGGVRGGADHVHAEVGRHVQAVLPCDE